jgi:aryl-alcohol dehydrogenase-like predicted oxidoreductase
MSGGDFARIGLGTAQFGLPYGITNTRGMVPLPEVRRILEVGRMAGIGVLDTAFAYGTSETVLGMLEDAARGFRVITKTPPLDSERIGPEQEGAIRLAIAQSRRSLRRERLDGLLVHHAAELFRPGGERIIAALEAAKTRGEVARIGVSVYDPAELQRALAIFTPEIVQIPLNVLDQRFAASGLLAHLKSLGCEIHARSVFLQGTLLAPADALPAALAHLRPALAAARRYFADHAATPLQGCLGYALSQPEVDCLILGLTGADELAAALAAVRNLPALPGDVAALAVDDPAIINPALWRLPSPDRAL